MHAICVLNRRGAMRHQLGAILASTILGATPSEFYGTVTYVDPVAHRIDLDYVNAGRHYTRNVYYDEGATRWNGVRYGEIRNGDRITVRGRQDGKRWRAEARLIRGVAPDSHPTPPSGGVRAIRFFHR